MIRDYTRVSSDTQDYHCQRHALDNWLSAYGNSEKVKHYEECAQGDKDRPKLKQLLADLKKGDTLLVFALDRLSREGIVAVVSLWRDLQARGIRLVSISEPWADTNNPAAEIVIAVMAWAAEQEKRRLKARQKAGIEAARAKNGGRCPWGGRAKGQMQVRTPELDNLVRKLKAEGKSVCSISRLCHISRPTVYTILKTSN